MKRKPVTEVQRRGITNPHAIAAIADFCGMTRATIWRVAVGRTAWRRARPMVLRSLLQAGWTPKADTRADVHAFLSASYIPT